MTLVGESMGAVLALTTAAGLPERVRRVVAVNTYDFRGGIARSSLLARLVISGVRRRGVGPVIAGVEPKPALTKILRQASCGGGDDLPRAPAPRQTPR
ncbi:pimeloyl-ACP methyl ester carboxylesterase [Streptomyces sp. V4I2]|nr:pimeloyl-ACP methyl ester carboxylesterase [Streptomyces sp. V4I2]